MHQYDKKLHELWDAAKRELSCAAHLCTRTAKKLAIRRAEFMDVFFRALKDEIK